MLLYLGIIISKKNYKTFVSCGNCLETNYISNVLWFEKWRIDNILET